MNNLKLILTIVGSILGIGVIVAIVLKQIKSCLAKNNNMSNAEL